MSENTVDLRTTTISLDEYNMLKSNADKLQGLNGGQVATINLLNQKVTELEQKQPQVRIYHYNNEYDGYDDEYHSNINKVEFINLTEVTRLAEEQAKKSFEEKLNYAESVERNLKYKATIYNEQLNTITEQLADTKKAFGKEKKAQKELLEEKEDTYKKNVDLLNKAYKEDEKSYKETIKDLKDEALKIKDSKTDAEVEEKRNKEIKDLKGRIKDLEALVTELGSMNFFKRTFKLRTISAERLAAQEQLLERENAADDIGITWVKENNKYRKYNAFNETLQSIFQSSKSAYNGLSDWITTSKNMFGIGGRLPIWQ